MREKEDTDVEEKGDTGVEERERDTHTHTHTGERVKIQECVRERDRGG